MRSDYLTGIGSRYYSWIVPIRKEIIQSNPISQIRFLSLEYRGIALSESGLSLSLFPSHPIPSPSLPFKQYYISLKFHILPLVWVFGFEMDKIIKVPYGVLMLVLDFYCRGFWVGLAWLLEEKLRGGFFVDLLGTLAIYDLGYISDYEDEIFFAML